MTELEWLSSDDPQRLLKFLAIERTVEGSPWPYRVSDHKLHLFEDACFERFWLNLEDIATQTSPPPGAAALLREIMGNPFRPVLLFVSGSGPGEVSTDQSGTGNWWPLTPTVLTLARSAEGEPLWRECARCEGIGTYKRIMGLPAACEVCHGTGRIESGELDTVTLAVLADALEERGCDNEALLMHLRGRERCPCRDEADHISKTRDRFAVASCAACDGNGWCPLRGPHVRGCWAVDLILGQE